MAPAPSVGKLTPNLAMDTEGTRLVNLTVLQRVDPAVEDILITADHVTLYDFNIELSQWSRRDVEGSLFVVKRNTQPRFQFIVMNRRNTGAQDANVLRKTNHPNGSLPVFDNATLASLHDSQEFINGTISSFATLHQAQIATSGLKAQKQEQNAMHNIPLPTFISGSQMVVAEAQGAVIPPKMFRYHLWSMTIKATSQRENFREDEKSPPCPKFCQDKASMLDEIIDRVKFLQLQVKVLNMSWLGAPRAVVPLLTESQPQGHSNPPLSAPTISQGLLDTPDLEDGFTFEQGVMKLMETSITSAMQYLQNKVLCLMPIALASAISNQEGIAAAAIPPEK